jgi:hypothetical protein
MALAVLSCNASPRSDPMAFESVKAEIALLMAAMKDAPQDKHELYLELMQKLNELKAYGMPLPDDLVALERQLEHEFAADQRARHAAERRAR